MALYRIVCTRQLRAGTHGHIVEVGIGVTAASYSKLVGVGDVRQMIENGDSFYTVSSTTGKTARVEKYTCCGIPTLRSGSDAIADNNLDNLNICS